MTLADFFDTYFTIVLVSILFTNLVLVVLPKSMYLPFQKVVLRLRKEIEEMVQTAFKRKTLEVLLLSKFLVPFLIFLIVSKITLQLVSQFKQYFGIMILLYIVAFLLIVNAIPQLQDLDEFLSPDSISIGMFTLKVLMLIEFDSIAMYIPPFFIIVLLIIPYSILFGEQIDHTSMYATS